MTDQMASEINLKQSSFRSSLAEFNDTSDPQWNHT